MLKYSAAVILANDDWEILCPIGVYESEEAAQRACDSAKPHFVRCNGRAFVELEVAGAPLLLSDDDVSVSELSAAARKRIAPPLDMRIPCNVDKAGAALLSGDPRYVVSVSDFIPSPMGLEDFLAHYSQGYRPDHIANRIAPAVRGIGVHEVKSSSQLSRQ